MYVDAHTHLIHPSFATDADAAALRALEAGVTQVIVNGLEPKSNRAVLELCRRYEHLLPALGIYPVDAAAAEIAAQGGWSHPWAPPAVFDVDAEVAWIAAQANEIVAIGECGLDAYWAPETLPAQERALRQLIEVALKIDKPLILHTRKAEERTFAILQEMGVRRADFHCYGGKLKLAERIAAAGYYFSIPPVVVRAESFQQLTRRLPVELLLTETDAPYMGPDSERNEPAKVPIGVDAMAKVLGITRESLAEQIAQNFERLFEVSVPRVG